MTPLRTNCRVCMLLSPFVVVLCSGAETPNERKRRPDDRRTEKLLGRMEQKKLRLLQRSGRVLAGRDATVEFLKEYGGGPVIDFPKACHEGGHSSGKERDE